MVSIRVERLDHIGVIAAVINDLGLMHMINARLVPDAQEVITPGEAVAGMLLNGLGFANRPLSLTPQFFASTPLDLLFRAGVSAEMFHRFTLGRRLDEAYTDGCDLLFQELALEVCAHDGIDLRGKHLDTTSFALSGAYVPERDEPAISITHGYSRDHRPDLKPAVLELIVSQDGGGPFLSQSWDGQTSDTQMFQERAQALMTAFTPAPSPRYLLADSKRYHDDHAANLEHLGCIPRIPNTIGSVSQVIRQALTGDTWHPLDEQTRYQGLELCHYGMAQRWLVVHAHAALERAEATVNHARQREEAAIAPQLFPLQAPRFETPEMAHEALAELARSWTYHRVESCHLIAPKRYARTGRPTSHTPLKAIAWHIQAHTRPDQEALEHRQQGKACGVLGTNIEASELSDTEVIPAYTGQSRVEGGCRLLKDPRFFGSSLLVKKPCRIQGLLMVMPLALLVYSVTPRRRRQEWAAHNETVPNHIHQPTAAPTLRWVFQLLEGIHRVRVTAQGRVHALIDGLNDVQIKVLRLFGEHVCCLYQISPG
jgi:transposase